MITIFRTLCIFHWLTACRLKIFGVDNCKLMNLKLSCGGKPKSHTSGDELCKKLQCNFIVRRYDKFLLTSGDVLSQLQLSCLQYHEVLDQYRRDAYNIISIGCSINQIPSKRLNKVQFIHITREPKAFKT